MATLDSFIIAAAKANVRFTVDPNGIEGASRTHDDSFFQVPLLSLCVLVIAKSRRSGVNTTDVPCWAGATLTKHFDDSVVVRRRLEWSIEYRSRCADSIVFLENIGMIAVFGDRVRAIECTERGSRFIREQLRATNETGVLIRALTKAYRIVELHGLELF